MVGDILQPTHLLFILVVALLVLGPKRLPEVGRSLGNGLRDFKDAISGESRDSQEEISSPTAPVSSRPAGAPEPTVTSAPPAPVPEPAAPTAAEPVVAPAPAPAPPLATAPIAAPAPPAPPIAEAAAEPTAPPVADAVVVPDGAPSAAPTPRVG